MDINLAENLRVLRQKLGYSLEEVAELTDVSRQAVGKWEMGESLPDLLNTLKLSTLYKVSLDELVLQKLSEKSTQQCSKVMGMLEVGSAGQIHLPDEVMDLFDIHTGENVLLLADKAQGIAIMKCSQFDRRENKNGNEN